MSLGKVHRKIVVFSSRCSLYKNTKLHIFNCFGCVVAIGFSLFSGGVSAFQLKYSDLSSGYSNCSYTDTSATTATIKLSIDYKVAGGHTGGAIFVSRGILIYTYDEHGNINPNSSAVSSSVTMNGLRYSSLLNAEDYVMYQGAQTGGKWTYSGYGKVDVVIIVSKRQIASWPAIAVRAGNYTSSDDVGEIAGVAYIGPSSSGSCTVLVNPEIPPPAISPKVTMTAPDWDLGELPRGEKTTLTLPGTKDQLCFSYEGSTALSGQKYLINATNVNGVAASGSYLLKSLEDGSQTVPYTLTLANSDDSVILPNIQNRLFSLDASGRTCFTPTFKAEPDRAVAAGAYSDILTFTVIAKP